MLVIGLDYGSDSARAVLTQVSDGKEIASATLNYPRWEKGLYCDPSIQQYRQHPLDYIEAAEYIIKGVLKSAPAGSAEKVVGLAFDTTGSTPCFVDKHCMPLALSDKHKENPNAMFILWKDHTSVAEASQINTLAHKSSPDYTSYCGGTYSSEWFWAKALHVINNDMETAKEAFSVVECSEWLPAYFAGISNVESLMRSRCACGHKAMWHESWGGFPPAEFFSQLHPYLGELRTRMSSKTYTADKPIGHLSKEWAARLGLSTKVVIAGGAIDAHMGAIGAGIQAYSFVRVMGTSTCDMMVMDTKELGEHCVRGICGQVDGSIIPNMIGLEAGQSAYGDVFAWFVKLLQYPLQEFVSKTELVPPEKRSAIVREVKKNLIVRLSEQAGKVDFAKSSVYALDWFNGRRTPDANQRLKAAIHGLTLGSDAPTIFRALVEATAFGSRLIVERFRSEGVRIDNVIALGGIAKKSTLAIQILSDVLNMPIRVSESSQACALGAAITAATAAGCYASIPEAQKTMASGFSREYKPDAAAAAAYDKLFKRYVSLSKFTETQYAHM